MHLDGCSPLPPGWTTMCAVRTGAVNHRPMVRHQRPPCGYRGRGPSAARSTASGEHGPNTAHVAPIDRTIELMAPAGGDCAKVLGMGIGSASMRTRRRRDRAILVLMLAVIGCSLAMMGVLRATGSTRVVTASTTSHIVVIVMENKESGDVLGSAAAPYLNGLARQYGVATQSFAIGHPSLPNYLALTSGATHGITSDCTSCSVRAPNIVDQLSGAGMSWKAYLEGYPARCFAGAGVGAYAKKHNPFIYYRDIAGNPARCKNLVGFGALTADLRAGRLPTFAWITPNLCDDTHDCGIATGDRFLARTVPSLLREIGPHGFLVVSWDEGTTNRGCCGGGARGGHIATVVAGPDVIAGSRTGAAVDHYGVLATIEHALALPALGRAADARSGRLDTLFRRPPRVR